MPPGLSRDPIFLAACLVAAFVLGTIIRMVLQ